MGIGWRTIATLERFLCERQNILVKKKADLRDVSFKIKKGSFGGLLKEINKDVFRINPITPDWLESILRIFVRDRFIEPIRDDKNRFMVSEEAYRLLGIDMVKPALARKSWVRPKGLPKIKKEKEIKVKKEAKQKEPKERQKEPELKEDLKEGKIKEEIEARPEEKAPEEEKKIEKASPQPVRWIMSEQEAIDRTKAIARFEKGILLYYEHRYQGAIIEFQKIINNYFDTVIDVVGKAKQYMKFCKDDLRKIEAKEKKKMETQVPEGQKEKEATDLSSDLSPETLAKEEGSPE